MAVYDLATAMAEAEAVCAFAKQHKNAMAYCKGTELRAKLSGLLIDRIEVVPVDLLGALQRAEARVLDVTPLPLSSRGSIGWRSHIPSSQVVNPEAGPADGQVRS